MITTKKLLRPHTLLEADNEVLHELDILERDAIFNELSYQISQREVNHALIDFLKGKAPGLHNVAAEILKACRPIILSIVIKLFSNILSNGEYPSGWFEGLITPLHKKGVKTDPANYCGITVTSALGKVFGIILCNRLMKFCERHMIENGRSAIRKKCRTVENVFKLILFLIHTARNEIINHMHVLFKKSFDSVCGVMHSF